MCGITGFIDTTHTSTVELLNNMSGVLAHRGPDDAGHAFFQETSCSVGLAHRRLSIIDLSPAAHQPMFSECGNIGIILNGEIYNFTELRAELEREGIRFFSNSDTEVALRAYLHWGMQAVHRFIGMFACAIYDRTHQKLFLLRDRTGIKPLYYYRAAGLFLFASELKSFHAASRLYKGDRPRQPVAVFQVRLYPGTIRNFQEYKKTSPRYLA